MRAPQEEDTAATQPLPSGSEETGRPALTAASPQAPGEVCCGSARAAPSGAVRQVVETVLPAGVGQAGDPASLLRTQMGLCLHVSHLRG